LQENIDIVVQFDVEYLRTLLGRVVPTASVVPVPGSNGTVILTGWVGKLEDIDVIVRTAVSVVGDPARVGNAMQVGGVMQVQLDAVVARVNRTAMRNMGFNLLVASHSAIFGQTTGQIAPVQTAGTTQPSFFANNGAGMAGGSSSSGSNQTGL